MSVNLISKRAGETRNVAVDFSPKLDAGPSQSATLQTIQGHRVRGEFLTGTPTVVEWGSSALTISGAGLNLEDQVIAGKIALASRAVVFTVAGGVSGTLYTVRITAVSDADAAQTLIEEIQIRVN